jgi:hypothetical protein
VYALVRSLATQRQEHSLLNDPAATVVWLTLCAQWPYATREMLERFGEHAAAGAPAPAGRTALRTLYDAAAPALDERRRQRFDHDTLTLERMLDATGTLSWDEIRVLRAYTMNFNPALDAELRAESVERPAGARG